MAEVKSAISTLQVDNERVRVTHWNMAPGATTGYHKHKYDYVIIPVLDGELEATGPQGTTRGELKAGVSYFREAGVEHDVRNVNAYPYAFVEVELKQKG